MTIMFSHHLVQSQIDIIQAQVTVKTDHRFLNQVRISKICVRIILMDVFDVKIDFHHALDDQMVLTLYWIINGRMYLLDAKTTVQYKLINAMVASISIQKSLSAQILFCQVSTINDLEKLDTSEIERTYNIRKQQSRFYWVCSWELTESPTNLIPPNMA